jgi:hypothetical protein
MKEILRPSPAQTFCLHCLLPRGNPTLAFSKEKFRIYQVFSPEAKNREQQLSRTGAISKANAFIPKL